MTKYVIVRRRDYRTEYVSSQNPQGKSYTTDLRYADTYVSQEVAKVHACGNESVEALDSHLLGKES